MWVEGRELLNFCSNDYLGLASHPRVIESLRQGALRYGVGSGASHLVCGHSAAHHMLEEALADFTGRPRALLFGTGFAANTGTLGALLKAGDTVLQDRLNHASLLDGALASGARLRRFAHSDTAALAAQLTHVSAQGCDKSACLIAVDGVFSMDGDIAPLAAMAQLGQQHAAWLMVDDAHGFGVLGERGAGSTEAAGLGMSEVPVLMATLGKALGCAGAFVAGSEDLIEALLQLARNYVYSTAMPPAVAVAGLTALNLMRQEPERRACLLARVAQFRQGAKALGLALVAGATGAIQALIIGDARRAMYISKKLAERGLWVAAIRPPTVPAGTARLRITLSAAHTEADVELLLAVLADCEINRGVGRHDA